MDGVPLIAKIFGVGVILIIGETVLDKGNKADIAFALGLGGVIIVMVWVTPLIFKLFSSVTTTFGM